MSYINISPTWDICFLTYEQITMRSYEIWIQGDIKLSSTVRISQVLVLFKYACLHCSNAAPMIHSSQARKKQEVKEIVFLLSLQLDISLCSAKGSSIFLYQEQTEYLSASHLDCLLINRTY